MIEQQKKQLRTRFNRDIKRFFGLIGFPYINTTLKHLTLDDQVFEMDFVSVHENLIFVGEETTLSSRDSIRDHLRKKSDHARNIINKKTRFITLLKETWPEIFSEYQYSPNRTKIFFLYFTKFPVELADSDASAFEPYNVIEDKDLSYFLIMATAIKKSARYELFRYLQLSKADIGNPAPNSNLNSYSVPIIVPEDNTGILNGIRIVTFMMDAKTLIESSYVLRKDSWEEQTQLYQRLLFADRMKKIRQFILTNKTSFLNNIIVGLPDEVEFVDTERNCSVSLDHISNYKSCKLRIPIDFNSICIIDGQHRIYAHYESDDKDGEEIMVKLRNDLNLLVTGLVFPKTMEPYERFKFESKIFLDINSNSKPVTPDLLLHIQTLQDPFSDVGVARQVVERLNADSPFKGMFELSLVEKSKIKIASIIKFGLRYLVSIDQSNGRKGLVNYWDGNKGLLLKNDKEELDKYIVFAASSLRTYFCAIENTFKDSWDVKGSALPSTTTVNGFIMAFQDFLNTQNASIEDFKFYCDRLARLRGHMNFLEKPFKFASSRYRSMSGEIFKICFSEEP